MSNIKIYIRICYLIPLFLVISCTQSTINNHNAVNFLKPRIFKPSNVETASTDYVFDFKQNLPEGFYFDTITIKDTICRAQYDLYCLQCSLPGKENFNKSVKNELLSRVEYEKGFIEPYTGEELIDPVFTFEMGPFEFFSNENVLSMCYVIDTYGWGGNHHNYSWFTVNYNLKSEKMIRFKDIFNLKNYKDSVSFADLIIQNPIDAGCFDFSLPFDSVDFSFFDGGLCINPELSWACGMNRAFVPFDSLRRYMKRMYY